MRLCLTSEHFSYPRSYRTDNRSAPRQKYINGCLAPVGFMSSRLTDKIFLLAYIITTLFALHCL